MTGWVGRGHRARRRSRRGPAVARGQASATPHPCLSPPPVGGRTGAPAACEGLDAEAIRIVACVDLGLRDAKAPLVDGGGTRACGALRRVEEVVRTGDRVCPLGTSRVAVAFGPEASEVPPRVLGERLTREVEKSLLLDGQTLELAVVVGMASADRSTEPPPVDLTRLVLSANGAARSHTSSLRTEAVPAPPSILTVDRLVDLPSTDPQEVVRSAQGVEGSGTPSGSLPAPLALHRRDIFWCSAGRVVGNGWPPAHDGRTVHGAKTKELTALIVDPSPSESQTPGVSALTAASIAERLGFRSRSVVGGDGDRLELAVDGAVPDVVVLVLECGTAGSFPIWSSSPWRIPARLTASYRAAGSEVLCVSAGAGAGALAACVEQGAAALFDLDLLPSGLGSLRGSLVEGTETNGPDSLGVLKPRGLLPPRFEALVRLTTSERRVLFYLTLGWTAQDIADNLVVSLTTVRSHIRAILRKLDVRSQLAAVAIANTRDPGLESKDLNGVPS